MWIRNRDFPFVQHIIFYSPTDVAVVIVEGGNWRDYDARVVSMTEKDGLVTIILEHDNGQIPARSEDKDT